MPWQLGEQSAEERATNLIRALQDDIRRRLYQYDGRLENSKMFITEFDLQEVWRDHDPPQYFLPRPSTTTLEGNTKKVFARPVNTCLHGMVFE